MSGTTELKTERLLLRKYQADDAPFLYEHFGKNPKMYEYSGWNPYATAEMSEKTVQRFLESYADPHFYGWALECDGILIGTIGAYEFNEEKSQIEVGMSIDQAYWGHGYATEALGCVLHYLTEQENIHTVTAWCADDNLGSKKAMEKCGMTKTSLEPGGLEVGDMHYDKLNFAYTEPSAAIH